jgi:hypothetical protein
MKYKNTGLLDLGEMASFRINEFNTNRKESDLNELFYILLEMAKKILHSDFGWLDKGLLDETASQVTEDVLILIHKKPECFTHHENFIWYYRSASKNRGNSALTYLFSLIENTVYLDDMDHTTQLSGHLPRTDELAIRSDDIKTIIKSVEDMLRSTPRLKPSMQYLVWPIIFGLLRGSEEMFNTLPFRDRTALRIIILRSMSKSVTRIRSYYD